jgi:DNA-directed RNA polymerase specialized sigma subunit
MMDFKDPRQKKILDDYLTEYAPIIHVNIKRLKNEGIVPAGFDESELHEVGYHGLVAAAHRFDPNRHSSLPTYASHVVNGLMRERLHSQRGIPKSFYQKAKAMAPKKP